MTAITKEQLASSIDYTLLQPQAGADDIAALCDEAVRYRFYSVCVHTRWIPLAADRLNNSRVNVCSVVSFPHGADSTRIKVSQAHQAIMDGADEIDMVADLAAIEAGDSKYLTTQIQALARVCHSMSPKVTLKVIIESAAFDVDKKMFACAACRQGKADFIKTSTGLHTSGGARIEDVKLMKDAAGDCRVKAAGGIRTAEQALAMIQAGADRIGTSCGVAIMENFQADLD